MYSFSDGGQLQNVEQAVHRVEQLLQEGADMIDIGQLMQLQPQQLNEVV
jgi:dihydropteroate synthase